MDTFLWFVYIAAAIIGLHDTAPRAKNITENRTKGEIEELMEGLNEESKGVFK